MPPENWSVQQVEGTVADLLAATDAAGIDPPGPSILVCEPTDRALVLGSSQAEPSGTAAPVIVRRRSGGGAVLIEPHIQTWLEVVIRSDDDRWEDDLGRSFGWLGGAIGAALAGLGHQPVPHRGPARMGRWGATVCFSGLGPGELLIDERKVVGISQRRTRSSARFSVAIVHRFDMQPYARAFGLSDAVARSIEGQVGSVDRAGVLKAVLAALDAR